MFSRNRLLRASAQRAELAGRRQSRGSRSARVGTAGLLIGLCLLSLGVALGLLLSPDPVPEILKSATYRADFRPITEEFADEFDVNLTVSRKPGRKFSSPATGVVTHSWCRVGSTLSSGERLLAVAGTPILALATDIPPWRDFTAGLKGEDVTALQREFRELGYAVKVNAEFDSTTQKVAEDLIEDAGFSWSGTLSRQQMLWLPSREIAIGSCPVTVGDVISEQGSILQAGSGTTTFTLKVPAGKLRAGPRTLILGESRISLGTQLVLDDPKIINQITSSTIYRAWLESGGKVPLAGQLMLSSPIPVLAVPPSSLAGLTGDTPCVFAAGKPIAVEIISSSLGRSLVKVSGKTQPEVIDSRVPAGASCRS